MRANETLTQGKPLYKATFIDFYGIPEVLLFINLSDVKLFAKSGTVKEVKIAKMQLITDFLPLHHAIVTTTTKIQQIKIKLHNLKNEKNLLTYQQKKFKKMIENGANAKTFERDLMEIKQQKIAIDKEYHRYFTNNLIKEYDKLNKLQILAKCRQVEEIEIKTSILNGVQVQYPARARKYHIDNHNAKY